MTGPNHLVHFHFRVELQSHLNPNNKQSSAFFVSARLENTGFRGQRVHFSSETQLESGLPVIHLSYLSVTSQTYCCKAAEFKMRLTAPRGCLGGCCSPKIISIVRNETKLFSVGKLVFPGIWCRPTLWNPTIPEWTSTASLHELSFMNSIKDPFDLTELLSVCSVLYSRKSCFHT